MSTNGRARGELSARLRIACVIPRLSDGGAQVQVSRLLNELSTRSGVEAHLIVWGRGVHEDLIDADRVHVHTLGIARGTDLRGVTRLRRVLKEISADVVFSWLSIADVHAGLATLGGRRPAWVIAERDSSYPSSSLYRVRHTLGRRARAVVANSDAGVRWWTELGYAGPLFAVDNILAPVCAEGTGRSVRGAHVLSVGRLEPQKAPARVVESLVALLPDRRDFRATFVGDGTMRDELETMSQDRGIAGHVDFVGFQEDVPSWLESADVFITLSIHEGLPNALLEAVQRGVPVVASDIPEHIAVLGADYPYLVSSDSSALDVADVIARACETPFPFGAYDHAAARMREMTPGSVADQYVEVLRKIL